MRRWLAPIIVALVLPSISGADTIYKRFRPTAHPSPKQAIRIARRERRRWGGPSIIGRMRCESRLSWRATNGQYRGLLQIGSWWNYAYPRTPRRVRYSTESGGTKTVWTGWLPRHASPYHGYAAIRVGQRAVSGDGPSTSWECPV